MYLIFLAVLLEYLRIDKFHTLPMKLSQDFFYQEILVHFSSLLLQRLLNILPGAWLSSLERSEIMVIMPRGVKQHYLNNSSLCHVTTLAQKKTQRTKTLMTLSLVGENLISDFHKSLLSIPNPTFFPPTDPVQCYTIRLTQQEIQKAEKQITIPSNGESKPGI